MKIDYKAEVTGLVQHLITILKLGKNEIESLLKEGISKYLNEQLEKYYYSNNFLHRAGKVRFTKYYFPITATYNKLQSNFMELDDVFSEYKYITLVGSAGSGKSTLIKHIFLKSIKDRIKIPILIELRNLNLVESNIIDYIIDEILGLEIEPNKSIIERKLKSGYFLFLFDGFDEIYSDKKLDIYHEIDQFIDRYPLNYFMITTRPGGGTEARDRFYKFEINSLNQNDIIAFINMQINDRNRKKELIDTISNRKKLDYEPYLSNPLLLSMFILAFESHPEIPEKKSAFYRNVFDTLYSKHDGVTKSSFLRERKTGLQREDFENILSVFSFISELDGNYAYTEEYLSDCLLKIKKNFKQPDFSIEKLIFDLETSISILIKDGFEFKFPHRSLQEYFASLFLSKLSLNQKEKAYQKTLKVFKNRIGDRSLNLFTICDELDPVSLRQYLVIPYIENFIENNFKPENEIDRLRSIIKAFDMDLCRFNKKFLEKSIQFKQFNRPRKQGFALVPESNFDRSMIGAFLGLDALILQIAYFSYFISRESDSSIYNILGPKLKKKISRQLKEVDFCYATVVDKPNFLDNKKILGILNNEGIMSKIKNLETALKLKLQENIDYVENYQSSVDELFL